MLATPSLGANATPRRVHRAPPVAGRYGVLGQERQNAFGAGFRELRAGKNSLLSSLVTPSEKEMVATPS